MKKTSWNGIARKVHDDGEGENRSDEEEETSDESGDGSDDGSDTSDSEATVVDDGEKKMGWHVGRAVQLMDVDEE